MSESVVHWRPLVGSTVRAMRDDGAVRSYVVSVTRAGAWVAAVSVDAPGLPNTCRALGVAYLAEEDARAACEADFRASGSRWSWVLPTDLT